MFNVIATTARAAAPHVGQALIYGGKVVVAAGVASKAGQVLSRNADEMRENLELAVMDARIAKGESANQNPVGFQTDDSNVA